MPKVEWRIPERLRKHVVLGEVDGKASQRSRERLDLFIRQFVIVSISACCLMRERLCRWRSRSADAVRPVRRLRFMREGETANGSFLALTAMMRDVEERVGNACEVRFAIHVAFAHDTRVNAERVERKVHFGVRGREKDPLNPRAPRCAWQHCEGDMVNESDTLTMRFAWKPGRRRARSRMIFRTKVIDSAC